MVGEFSYIMSWDAVAPKCWYLSVYDLAGMRQFYDGEALSIQDDVWVYSR